MTPVPPGERPAALTLSRWAAIPRQPDQGLDVDGSGLIASGIPVEAVREYRTARAKTTPTWIVPLLADDAMFERLRLLAVACPGMRLTEAVGWVLVAGRLDPNWSPTQVVDLVARWAETDLGDVALVCAAAGLTPDEASAGVGDGSLTEAGVRTLAGLRGVPL